MNEYTIPLDLILRAQQGDQQAIEQVIRGNHFLILKFSNLHSHYTIDCFDDLFQAGSLGIWRAIKDYDPSKASFFTHSYNWVRSYIGREAYKHNRERLLPNISSLLETNQEFLTRSTIAKEKTKQFFKEIENALGMINNRTRTVICKKFGLYGNAESTVEELGQDMGITNIRVSQIIKEGLSTIKYIIEKGRLPRNKAELLANPNIKTRVDRKKELFPLVTQYFQEGRSREDIVKLTGLCDRTIRNWLKTT